MRSLETADVGFTVSHGNGKQRKEHTRFLEYVVETVSPEVSWKAEVTRVVVVDPVNGGPCGYGMLWQSLLEGTDVLIGRRDSLEQDGAKNAYRCKS